MRSKLFLLTAAAVLSAGLMSTSAIASHRHHPKIHHKVHHKVHLTKIHSRKSHFPNVSDATRKNVQAMIKAQAPRYGVPAWFALKIAKVESGFNPMVTGRAGEIGVYQMKCQTARGLGFSGSCSGLYNAATNIKFGLKHLSLAVKSSHGNMRLAASKHNGGLGRKSIVRAYVAMVF
jgi:soluble lytic murein transglycosylase-like protein